MRSPRTTGKTAHDARGGVVRFAAFCLIAVLFGTVGKASAAETRHWPRETFYTVVARPGDTVATIGARYGASVSALVRLNKLKPTSRTVPGQVLRVPAASHATREAVLSEAINLSVRNYAPPPRSLMSASYPAPSPVVVKTLPALVRPASVELDTVRAREGAALRFSWPLSGPVISLFGPGENGSRNDGINIAAERGEPFRAAADGTVSYAGFLRGYGNLILITHPDGYVTAYAHAENLAVARGDEVGKGQVIGTAGETGGVDRPQLHFEIRRGVRPVDPRRLLAANG